jgi:hypothetical protein
MAADFLKMTVNTLATLPLRKQEEVYDFAEFLRLSSVRTSPRKHNRKSTVLEIIGLGKSGIGDLALNHDKYLYDE